MADFGIVVVGLGIAGRVRVRDTLQCGDYESEFPVLKGVRLVGYVSRREMEIEGAQCITFEDAMKRADAQAFIICTENSRHEDYARKCLQAGKHVLVEYPLTVSKSGAEYLMECADHNKVQCCEEDIALLTDDFKRLQAISKEKMLAEGELTLVSGFNGWIENVESSGSPFMTSISRLHTIIHLFGDLTAVEATLEISEQEVKAFAKMLTKANKPITLSIKRKKGDTKRAMNYTYTFTDGTVVDNPTPSRPEPAQPPKYPGLFMRDFISFMEAVRNDKPRMPSRELTIKAIDLAEKLTELAKKKQ